MNQQTFDEFCSGRAMSDEMKKSFHDFLLQRHGGAIPENVNLEKLWKEFNRELTDRFLHGE